MTVLTTSGKNFFAAMFANESSAAITKIQIGSGNSTEEDISNTVLDTPIADYGCSIVTAGTIEYINTDDYPHALHLHHVFYPVGGDITIREIGILSSDTTPVLILRKVFSEFELSNDGLVPDGESVSIDAYFSLASGEGSYSEYFDVYQRINITEEIIISPTILTSLDESEFTCPQNVAVCFNGRALRNAEIVSVTERRGARAWEFRCYTQDYSDIRSINAVAAPVEVGISITGRQYTSSMLRSGTLRIWNPLTRVYDPYTCCRVDNDIPVEPFGTGWFYSVTVYESYYEDDA